LSFSSPSLFSCGMVRGERGGEDEDEEEDEGGGDDDDDGTAAAEELGAGFEGGGEPCLS